MKLSYQWLREWVSPKLDARALVERLTLAGIEVGGVVPAAPALDNVIVARVRSITSHPTAPSLAVCQVETARNKTVQVVCGAPNVKGGMKVALAQPGALLPDDRHIATATIQGVDSAGMLCSAAELGLGDDVSGVLVLDPEARVGESVKEALKLDDFVVDLELTPNRGDCLSVAGIAREVAALTGAPLTGPKRSRIAVKARKRVPVKLLVKHECPRYIGRVVQNLDPNAVTPGWMRERLRRSGVRSLHPIVDVTNYVMLELGQPMHAFDFTKLQGAVQVRLAGAEDALTLLDGTQLAVPPGSLVIADNRGAIALAGIMGGEATAVDARTSAVFLESAFFQPEIVARTARGLGLHTESAHRFERGVDPELQMHAVERATELILTIAGGLAGPITEARTKAKAVAPISLREARIAMLLGKVIPRAKVEQTLKRLGMQVRRRREDWLVTPPSYRFDIRIEADLIEEVARISGYEHIPANLPPIPAMPREISEARLEVSRVRALLVDRDYQEVVTYSFVDPTASQAVEPAVVPLGLANPISADMSVMRTSLWPGLLQTLQYNRNRQQPRVRIFELGRRFLSTEAGLHEARTLAGAVTGSAEDEQWGLPKRQVDFYDVKGDIEGLLALTGRTQRFRFLPAAHPALHPGQSAAIHLEGETVGWIGALHPTLQARFELGKVVLFEISLAAITKREVPRFNEISRFPAIRRDLAIVVAEATTAQHVLDAVRKAAGSLLVNLQLFDVYRGERIDSGRKSLALGLTLQDSSRTLRETEVDALITQVISTLTAELGAELRH